MELEPFLPKGGGLIQVDTGGYPPIPLIQNSSSSCHFFYIFSGPKLMGLF
jgi:hypothetical protein